MKERLENDKIVKIREEIELVMCTYYGNGKSNRDRLIDFVDTLKVYHELYIIETRSTQHFLKTNWTAEIDSNCNRQE